MYIMLCGYPPFNGDDEAEIFENVKNGELVFYDEEWANISSESKELIKKMLRRNPKTRISAKEALQDIWIQNNTHSSPLQSKILKNLSSFNTQNRFRHAIITYIAAQMTTKEDNDELLKAFTSLDTDGNGVLSHEELITGYSSLMPSSSKSEIKAIVDELMENLDVNHLGEINFTQFVVAAMNREKLLHSKQIENAFKMFDQDGNGFIDLNELKIAMSGVKLKDEEWQDLILKYDIDKDGVISVEEFKDLLLNFT